MLLAAVLAAATSVHTAAAVPKPAVVRRVPAAPRCEPLPVGKVPFGPGESFDYELDVLGVRLGTLTLETAPAPGLGKGAMVLRARASADTLAQNFRSFKGRASAT